MPTRLNTADATTDFHVAAVIEISGSICGEIPSNSIKASLCALTPCGVSFGVGRILSDMVIQLSVYNS